MNIPAALAGSLVTNPLTALLVYPLEYKLGVWLVGFSKPRDVEGFGVALQNFVRHAKPLWIGSLVVGSASAALADGLVMLPWRDSTRLRAALPRDSSG